MGIFDRFNRSDDEPIGEVKREKEHVNGKIMKILKEDGYGFISSKEIPFTRIFFHWSALKPSTYNFTELEVGMKVTFKAVEVPEKGWRALQIEVTPKESFTSPGHEP